MSLGITSLIVMTIAQTNFDATATSYGSYGCYNFSVNSSSSWSYQANTDDYYLNFASKMAVTRIWYWTKTLSPQWMGFMSSASLTRATDTRITVT